MSSKYDYRPGKPTTLIFLHVPKAAGMTLHSIIDRQYPKESIFNIGQPVREHIDKFKKLPEHKRAKIRCMKGHMWFGLHRYLPQPSMYITMLRNPVDRLVSHYFYVLRSPTHPLYKTVKSSKMNLREYVSSGMSPELNNGQVRLISGTSVQDDRASTDDLEAAKRNLSEYFVAVGLVERFDESLILFKKLLGWRNIYYMKQNVTHGRPSKREISPQTLRTIENHNSLDMELYKFGVQIFNQKIRGQKLGKSQLLSLRLLNRTYETAHRLIKTHPARGALGLASRFFFRVF